MPGCGTDTLVAAQPEPPNDVSMPPSESARIAEEAKVFWAGLTDPAERRFRNAPDWAGQIDFREVRVRTDLVFLYEQHFMEDVRTNGLGRTTRPEFDAEYAESLRIGLDAAAPGRNYDGIIVFDIESVPLIWGNRTDGPGIYPRTDQGPRHADLWYDWIRSTQPSLIEGLSIDDQERVLKRTYEGAIRLWITRTFDEARRQRPRAKFAMYGLPAGSRYGQYTWADPNRWKIINDEAQWLVDLQDVILVVLYHARTILPRGAPTPTLPIISYEQGVAYINDNITEARRIAPGKPVLALISMWYLDSKGDMREWLDAPAIEVSIAETAKAGADSLVIWEYFRRQGQSETFQEYLDASALPLLRQYWMLTGHGHQAPPPPLRAPEPPKVNRSEPSASQTPK